ncbi:MAG: patatin-like phospholipase family protein [Chlamydiia bacterium]
MDGRSSDRSFRILSLDGGAFAGVFTVRLLAEIEQRSGKKTSEFFDGFTGISAGAFLGAIMSHGDITAKDLIDELMFTIKKMRSSKEERFRSLWGALKPALNHDKKWEGVYRYFADAKLKDLRFRGVFPIWDFENKKIRIFDSDKDKEVHLCDVVYLSTCANAHYAAVDSRLSEEKFSGSDLALFVNDPRLLGVFSFTKEVQERGTHILSIGSSLAPSEPKESSFKRGPLRWMGNILPEIRQAQETFVNQTISSMIAQDFLPIKSHLRLNMISNKIVDGFKGDDELNIYFLNLAEELIERRSYEIDRFIEACENNAKLEIPVIL